MRAGATLYELLLGAMLLFAPWSRIWQENWFFWNAGAFRSLLMSGPARGAVSGLGAAFVLSAAGWILKGPDPEGSGEARDPAEPG